MSLAVLDTARRHLAAAFDALGSPSLTADERLAALSMAQEIARTVERFAVNITAGLQREGVFAERGYSDPTRALADLHRWDRPEARRRVVATEHVCPRTALDGTPLPPRLEHTAAAFAAERIDTRHVEIIARLLGSPAAERLTPEDWAVAEQQLAGYAEQVTPSELQRFGAQLIEALDQDGPEPDDDPTPAETNELFLTRHRGGPGGKLTGRIDNAEMFAAIATAIDALAKPTTGEDHRSAGERQAEALADLCRQGLDHGELPATGGRRPQLHVIVRLEDLENRARAAALDLGGTLSPQALRMLCCDAAVVPIVLGGQGQPLDVGRATRTIPDGLRRAVTARDRGCAFPGCDRPPSWTECHHVIPWETGGPTSLNNLVLLCRRHHRLIHHSDWIVRLRDGTPEFIPPPWIDPRQEPRRRPDPHRTPADRPLAAVRSHGAHSHHPADPIGDPFLPAPT